MTESKEVKIPFMIRNTGRRMPVYSYDGTKNYISFTEAQREIEFFLEAYHVVTYREYYSYAFNTYLEARLSKKEWHLNRLITNDLKSIKDPYKLAFEKQFINRSFGPEDVHADVERCTNYFFANGKLNLSHNDKLCYVGSLNNAEILIEGGRVSEAYQMVVLFHIFHRKLIKTSFVVPGSNEDEVYMKYLIDESVMYYVTPIRSHNSFGGSVAKAIDRAKQSLSILCERMNGELSDGGDDSEENNKYILILPGKEFAKRLFGDREFISMLNDLIYKPTIYFLDSASVRSTDMLKPKFVKVVM